MWRGGENRQLDPTSTIVAVALVIDAAKAPPGIAELGLY
jgi:hypothetical protein